MSVGTTHAANMVQRHVELLTNSRMQTFKTCPRKHHIEYGLALRPVRDGAPLRFGSSVHLGLEWLGHGAQMPDIHKAIRANYATPPDWCTSDDDVLAWRTECEQVCMLLAGYQWRWGNDGCKVLATELEFRLPLVNPETGRASRKYQLAGKIDKIAEREDAVVFVREHKTTGDTIAADSDYWKRIRLDQQISLYLYAARESGYPTAEYIEYDVIHRPGIRPRKTKTGRETIEEYGIRLWNDIQERPDFYFARQHVTRTDEQLRVFLGEVWDIQKTMAAAETHNRHYRNTGACTMPYRCACLDICDDSIDLETSLPEGFRRVDWIHPELKRESNDDQFRTATADGTAAIDPERLTAWETASKHGPDHPRGDLSAATDCTKRG